MIARLLRRFLFKPQLYLLLFALYSLRPGRLIEQNQLVSGRLMNGIPEMREMERPSRPIPLARGGLQTAWELR